MFNHKSQIKINPDRTLQRQGSAGKSLPAMPFLEGALQKVSLPNNSPVQMHKVNKADVGEWFYIKVDNEYKRAKLTSTNSYRDKFKIEGDGTEVEITNHKNILTEVQYNAKRKDGKGNVSVYNDTTFDKECQFPDCGKKFSSNSSLRTHIKTQHEFPKGGHPYTLYGNQGASSFMVIKNGDEFTPVTDKNGDGFHSEMGPLKSEKFKSHLKKNKAKKITPEIAEKFTTDMGSFMDKTEDSMILYITPDPHCGICTKVLKRSNIETTYPTNAKPVASKKYGIPFSLTGDADEEFEHKHKKFKPNEDHMYDKEEFPEVQTPVAYNNSLVNESSEKKVHFASQSVMINRQAYSGLSGALGNKTMNREAFKKLLREKPIPINPHTFEDYAPSPQHETQYSDDESDEELKQLT